MTTEPESDFSLSIEERCNYLYAFYTGPKDTLAVSTKIVTQISQEAEKRGISKVLMDEDFPNQVSTMEMYDICETLVQLFGRCKKVAHVDRNPGDLDLNQFGETIAVNRGLEIRAFATVEDAEKWLGE